MDIYIPPAGQHIWEWFWQLSSGRQSGINGPEPLSCTEIASWAHLTKNDIMPEEFDTLRAMDVAWCSAMADEIKSDSEKNKPTS